MVIVRPPHYHLHLVALVSLAHNLVYCQQTSMLPLYYIHRPSWTWALSASYITCRRFRVSPPSSVSYPEPLTPLTSQFSHVENPRPCTALMSWLWPDSYGLTFLFPSSPYCFPSPLCLWCVYDFIAVMSWQGHTAWHERKVSVSSMDQWFSGSVVQTRSRWPSRDRGWEGSMEFNGYDELSE